MSTYVTVRGDMWDKIAYDLLGSENYMGELIRCNPDLVEYVIFPSGVEVKIPDIDSTQTELPPWRNGLDEEADDLDEFEEEEEAYG